MDHFLGPTFLRRRLRTILPACRETSNTDPSSVVRSGAGTKEEGHYFDVGRWTFDIGCCFLKSVGEIPLEQIRRFPWLGASRSAGGDGSNPWGSFPLPLSALGCGYPQTEPYRFIPHPWYCGVPARRDGLLFLSYFSSFLSPALSHVEGVSFCSNLRGPLCYNPAEPCFFSKFLVPRRFQWYIAEGMLSLPTAKWSMVISFFSGVMASGFAFGCAKDTVEFFNAGIGGSAIPSGRGFPLGDFRLCWPMGLRKPRHDAYTLR